MPQGRRNHRHRLDTQRLHSIAGVINLKTKYKGVTARLSLLHSCKKSQRRTSQSSAQRALEPQVKDRLINHFGIQSTKITMLQDEKDTNTGLGRKSFTGSLVSLVST